MGEGKIATGTTVRSMDKATCQEFPRSQLLCLKGGLGLTGPFWSWRHLYCDMSISIPTDYEVLHHTLSRQNTDQTRDEPCSEWRSYKNT